MKRVIIAVVTVLALGSLLVASIVSAGDSQPASKATAAIGDINVVDTGATWMPILQQTIKTPNQKDLFIDVSLQSALYTRTLVKSKGGVKDTSTASATIDVRVLVDGVPAMPGPVTFNSRMQELSATFMGILSGDDLNVVLCDPQIDNDGDGDINEDPIDGIDNDEDTLIDEDGPDYEITINWETVDPEELELILETMSANSFNFIASDLESGVHTITVEAMINTGTAYQEGDAEAMATIGLGSVTIESVRMIQDWDPMPEIVD